MQQYRRRLSPSILLAGTFLMLAFSWALASSASAAIPGLERLNPAVSSLNSLTERSVVAECPAGKFLVGTGASVSGGAGEVVIDGITPTSDLKRLEVTAREDQSGTNAQWRLRAFAMCSNFIPGMHLASKSSIDDSVNKSATASCNFGERLLGAGAEIIGGNGQVKLDQINPNSAAAFAFAREDRDGQSRNWAVTSHAICAPPQGQQIVRAFGNGTGANVNATARCANGQKLVSGGFDSTLFGQGGEAVIDTMVTSQTAMSAQSKPDQAGLVLNRLVEAVAVCA